MVLSGAQPFFVEAFPMREYSMFGAVPLRTIKRALLSLRADGRLDRVKLLDLTNCTFDGHMYNVRRVMEECLAIKPDLIFLWDEAWSGFARFSPFLRPRTAMGAAADIAAWLRDPASVEAYEAKQRELGDSPSVETLMAARLVPDPRKVRLRVYQTNSTHKSMSAIRQGSMLLSTAPSSKACSRMNTTSSSTRPRATACSCNRTSITPAATSPSSSACWSRSRAASRAGWHPAARRNAPPSRPASSRS